RSNYSQLEDLDADRPSVVGARAVRSYFAVGELSPTVVLIEHPTLDFRSPQGRAAIEETSRRLAALGRVAEGRSLTRPVGKPEATTAGWRWSRGWPPGAGARAADPDSAPTHPSKTMDDNPTTRLEIVFTTDPFSESSLETLQDVRASLQRATAARQPLQGTNG